MNISDIEKEFVSEFRRKIPGLQERVASVIIALLSRLRLVNNQIAPTEYNYLLAEEIKAELGAIIYQNGYLDMIRGYTRGLVEVRSAQDAIFARLIPDFPVGAENPFNAVFRNSAKTAIETLSEGAVRVQQQEFANLINTAIGSSETFSQTVDAIRANITGTDEFKGRLEAYSGTYAKDAATVTNATYLDSVSTAYGLDWFSYSGPILDDDSREFCIERVNNIYHRKEIELWGDGVNTGLQYPQGGEWPGMNRATNERSIFSLRGGYNCNHNFIPVSIDAVPESKIKEARDNGWLSD